MKRTLTSFTILVLVSCAAAGSMELTSARLYKKQKEWLKALQFYSDAIKRDPTGLEAYFERGELLGGIAADPTLKDVATQIAEDKSNPSRDLYRRMLADFKEAQTPRTPADEKLVKKYKKQIGEILEERWYSFYASAVHFDSLYTEAKAQTTVDHEATSYLENALAELEMCILLLPEKWNAHGLKAQLLGKLGREIEATRAWEDARRCLLATHEERKAAADDQKALNIIQANLLENYYSQNRLEDAIALADEILTKDAKDSDAIQYKAFSLARMAADTSLAPDQRAKLKAEAVKALESARSARPDDPIILYYMGQFNLQLGDTAAAVRSFQEYLAIDSTDRDVLFALGVLYLEGGTFANTAKARDIYARLTVTDSTNPAAWINYGVALIRLGENEAGRKAVEKGKALQNK